MRLAVGSNAASVWRVNGKDVIGIYGDRPTVIDDGVSKRLTLHQGPNVVRAAIVNGGGATDFCARFLDAAGQAAEEGHGDRGRRPQMMQPASVSCRALSARPRRPPTWQPAGLNVMGAESSRCISITG